MKPSSATAARTRSLVLGVTNSGLFRTFDTVPTDTAASTATSRMLLRWTVDIGVPLPRWLALAPDDPTSVDFLTEGVWLRPRDRSQAAGSGLLAPPSRSSH